MTLEAPEATAAQEPQRAFDEDPLQDEQIETALENWQIAQDNLTAAKDELRDADKMLQALVSQQELDEGTYRCGRFVVKLSNVAAHQRVRPKLAKTK